MSFATAESALETIIKLVTGYSSTNVSKGDDRILATGQDKVVILRPGPFTRENLSPGIVNNSWQILMELYIPFRGEIITFWNTIRTERQALIDKIDTYPTLNRASGVMLGTIDSGDEPEPWQVGSQSFWKQTIRVTVKESVQVVYAE